jgi:hypothetical protein
VQIRPGLQRTAIRLVKGFLLGHTNSAGAMKERFDQASSESVGYAAIVY